MGILISFIRIWEERHVFKKARMVDYKCSLVQRLCTQMYTIK